MGEIIRISEDLLQNFIKEVKEKYPVKSFGYFISSEQYGQPDEYIIFEKDVRNKIKDKFIQYGDYYVRYEDAGFCATDEELYNIQKYLSKNKKYIVGIFHSHQRHPAIFSTVDADMHPAEQIWHLIISLRNFEMPQIKAFSSKDGRIVELEINVVDGEKYDKE